MQKTCWVAVLFLLTGFRASCVDLGLGTGLAYSLLTATLTVSDPGLEGSTSDHYHFGTVEAYVDATYAIINLSYAVRFSGSYDSRGSFVGSGTYTNRETYLGISVLFGYPFSFGRLSLRPLIGVASDVNLSYKDANGNDLKSGMSIESQLHLNRHFLKVGLESDITFGTRFYLRPVALLGFKLPSIIDRDVVEYYMATYGLVDVSRSTTKLDFAILAGYRL